MNVVMAKRDFPEVRSMIEFDRLVKNHLMDAYSQLLPTTKRLIRKFSSSEQQIVLQEKTNLEGQLQQLQSVLSSKKEALIE